MYGWISSYWVFGERTKTYKALGGFNRGSYQKLEERGKKLKDIQKILESQDMNEEELMNYVPRYNTKKELVFALSDNAPENHALNSEARDIFGILEDIVHMYELYYN